MKKECKYCKNEIEFENGKQFGAHLTNCKSNPKKILRDIESKKKLDFELTCRCGQKYKILSTVENLHKGKYKKFCSKSCSNSREHSDDVKLKISQNLKLKYKSKSRKKLEYICLECQNSFFDFESKKRKFCSINCSTRNRNKNGLGRKAGIESSKKQNKRSKNEIEFAEFCKLKFNDVLTNESIFNGWDADIIIEDLKVAILWNGNWHYKKITKTHSLEQVQNRDRIKIQEIKKCGYTPYIIKDTGKFDLDKVIQEWEIFNNWISNKDTL